MGKLQAQAEAFNNQQGNVALEVATKTDESFALLLSPSKFDQMWKVAQTYANSKLVPAHFAKDPHSVFVALQMAFRMEIDPFMLMQHMYTIKGKPGLESILETALFNQRATEFTGGIRYDIKRDKAGRIVYCQAWSVRKDTGERVEGTPVTAELVRTNGWEQPKGTQPSLWRMNPELMYRYRSASYLIRHHAGHVTMGLKNAEELKDTPEPIEAEVEVTNHPVEGEVIEATVVEDDVPDLSELEPNKPTPEPEKKVQVQDNTGENGRLTLQKILDLLDMVGMPTKDFEAACKDSGVSLDDARHSQKNLQKLEGLVSAWADRKMEAGA